MNDISPTWNSYARLQAELRKNTLVSKASWATEEAMDHLLDLFGEGKESSLDEIGRAKASALRRYRHRNRLTQLKNFSPEQRDVSIGSHLEARAELRALQDKSNGEDFSLLVRLGVGFDYAEIAADTGMTTGNLRQRVLRTRQKIMGGAT